MYDFIDKDALFGDDYRAVILCEYTRDLSLIKQLIEIAENAVYQKMTIDTWTYDGICYLFAKSVVSYAKMAYDNMILGHFDATNMIVRTIIENNVCLDIMQRYKSKELWKYYVVQSYKNSLMCYDKKLSDDELNFLDKVYSNYSIEDEFIEKSKKNNDERPYAYIDKNYGWTYKVNKNFTFSGLCELVNKRDYHDFKIMSMYSHGTDIHLKISGTSSMNSIMGMISSIYIGLYRLINMYCLDKVDIGFDSATDEIEEIIYKYLDTRKENVQMSEQLSCILNRIDGRHLSKLWLFYRDYFQDDTSCLQFLYDVLKNEPQNSTVMHHLSNPHSEADPAESGLTIRDDDFISRRMINAVERLVSAARDMDQIRRGKDVFKVVFLVTCVETLQNLRGSNDTKIKQLFDFFVDYTDKDDKEFISHRFILENEDSESPEYDGFQCFIGAINEYRNRAAHEGDYWDYCFNNNNDGYPLLVLLNIDLKKFSRSNKKEHCFHTTISYKAFEEIFVRTCIHFIQSYISNKQN